MTESELKIACEYYKMGKANERLIMLNILKYGLAYENIDKLIQTREAMEQLTNNVT